MLESLYVNMHVPDLMSQKLRKANLHSVPESCKSYDKDLRWQVQLFIEYEYSK